MSSTTLKTAKSTISGKKINNYRVKQTRNQPDYMCETFYTENKAKEYFLKNGSYSVEHCCYNENAGRFWWLVIYRDALSNA